MSEPAADLYDLYWENSKLNAATVQAFRRRVQGHVPPGAAPALQFAGPDVPLGRARGRLAKLMAARRSSRSFSPHPLPEHRLGALFGAFASPSRASRTFPSAGATYALEVFCLLNNVAGDLNRRVVYYNHDNHSLAAVREAPDWEEIADAINLELEGAPPQLLFVFVLFPERVTAKYGERGGRFALLEAGHAAQNLALALVDERLAGCEVGGLLDERLKSLLGLEGTTAQVALGYACGLPTGSAIPARGHPIRRRLARLGASALDGLAEGEARERRSSRPHLGVRVALRRIQTGSTGMSQRIAEAIF